jgi:hypothetical protein
MSLDPIVATITVPATPTEAFVGFTAQMGEWWDPLLTPDPATWSSVEIDPEGDVAMVHGSDRHVWGRVIGWDPLGHYTQDFWLGHPKEHPTRLDVRFHEVEDGTRVELEHSGWTEATAEAREKFTHWDDLLQRYAAHVS